VALERSRATSPALLAHGLSTWNGVAGLQSLRPATELDPNFAVEFANE
jgi:hypothetical protein